MKPENLIVPKRRRGELSKVLPGFVSHKAFFGSLTGGFTAVALDAKAKRRLVEKIGQIHGSPNVEVRSVVRDWMESAIVREVRKYENGETFVRFEARFRSAEDKPLDSEPLMLMLALSSRGRVRRYTFVFGTGRNFGGVNIVMSRDRGGRSTSRSFSALRRFVATMRTDDFFIIEGAKGSNPFFQSWCDKSEGGGVFTTEYALVPFAWHFSTKNLLRRDDVLRLVDRFAEGGFRELGDAADWGQLPVEEMENDKKDDQT